MNKITYCNVLKGIRNTIPETQRSDFDLQFACNEKNIAIALVLSFFLGALGIDRFYLGQVGLGLLKLFTFGGFGIWTVIDWFRIVGLARKKNIDIANKLNPQATPSIIASPQGKTTMTRKIFIPLGIVFVIVVLSVVGIISKQKENNYNTASQTKGYKLSPKEKTVLIAMLTEDGDTFVRGGKTLLHEVDGLLSVSAKEVQQDYDTNQVAADQKYYQKALLVSGVISSIGSGLGNKPYITLRGTNEFMEPHATFKEENINKISALKKGQKLNLICVGSGAVMGVPSFDDCQFADDYALSKLTQISKQVGDYLDGKKGESKVIETIPIFSIALARLLPENSLCFQDESKCLSEIGKVKVKEIEKIKEIILVTKELRADGVQVSQDFLDTWLKKLQDKSAYDETWRDSRSKSKSPY